MAINRVNCNLSLYICWVERFEHFVNVLFLCKSASQGYLILSSATCVCAAWIHVFLIGYHSVGHFSDCVKNGIFLTRFYDNLLQVINEISLLNDNAQFKVRERERKKSFLLKYIYVLVFSARLIFALNLISSLNKWHWRVFNFFKMN